MTERNTHGRLIAPADRRDDLAAPVPLVAARPTAPMNPGRGGEVAGNDDNRFDADPPDRNRSRHEQRHEGDRRQRDGDRRQSRLAEPDPGPDPAAIDEIDQRQDRHVRHAAAEEIPDGKVGGARQGRTHVSRDLGQRSGAGEQEHADDKPAETCPLRDRIATPREDDPSPGHGAGGQPEDDNEFRQASASEPVRHCRDPYGCGTSRTDTAEWRAIFSAIGPRPWRRSGRATATRSTPNSETASRVA